MKSLLISSTYFPPQVGGISRLMANLASALGPDRICCLTGVVENGNGSSVPGNPELRIYRFPAVFSDRAKPVRAAAWGAAIGQIMLRERPRAVVVATADDGYLGLWLRRWLKLPYVVYAHGNEILNLIHTQEQGQRSRLALQAASRVLAVSQFTAELVRKAGVDADRIEIIHPGCDVTHFRPLPANGQLRQKLLGPRYKDRVILTVGNLVARKGHDMVIRALPRLLARVPNITYLIVGDGPHRSHLERLAIDVGVRDRVVFTGQARAESLADLYALGDIFVMPSREQPETNDVEGFGIVLLEASACAKPVVGGRSGGIPDAVVDGVTGLLVDPRDPQDIAKAIGRLLTDGELATRLGNEGRARAVREFDWTVVARRVEGVLDLVRREKADTGWGQAPPHHRGGHKWITTKRSAANHG